MGLPLEAEKTAVGYKAPVAEIVIPRFQLHARIWMSLILLLSDTISLAFAFTLAIAIRIGIFNILAGLLHFEAISVEYINIRPYQDLYPLIFLFISLFYLAGLYPGTGIGPVEELRRILLYSSIIFLTAATFLFFGKSQLVYSRSIFAMSWVLALMMLPLGRTLFRTLFGRSGLWGEPVAIIGNPKDAEFLISHLRQNYKIGLFPAAFFFDNPIETTYRDGIPFMATGDLSVVCRQNRIHCALVIENGEHVASQDLRTYQEIFNRVILLSLKNREQLLWVSVQDLGGLMGYEIKHNLNSFWPKVIKRLIDILVSSLVLFLLSPLFALIILLVLLDSPGPAFYSQKRVGKNGREFDFIKIRTMRTNADKMLEDYLAQNPKAREEWNKYQKLKNDPRITRLGGLLRRYSIDELPQFWNVLIGQMSLIGPRPFFLSQTEEYGQSITNYTRVRPGLTGFWQVSGRNRTTFDERVALDDYYIRNWSIWLDIYILLRTVWVVLRRDGAY